MFPASRTRAVAASRWLLHVVVAAAASACGSDDAPATPATPEITRLVVVTQPSALTRSGVPLERAPVVEVQTLAGDPVRVAGRAVSVSIVGAEGTLVGNAATTTDAEGRATFTGLGIAGPTGARTLAFDIAGTPSVASWTITVRAGLPASVTILSGDQQRAPAGSALPLSVRVRVLDASGNVVPDAEVRYTVAAGGGIVSPAVDTSEADGTSTMERWTMGPSVGVGMVQVLADRAVATLSATSLGLIATRISSSLTTCGVTPDSAIRCWGWGQYGQLGDGQLDDRDRPGPVVSSLPFSDVAVGAAYTCGLTTAGDVQCWGYSSRLGDGSTVDRPTPGRVPLASRAIALSASGSQACAITEGRETWCWGDNDFGEVGDAGTGQRPIPSRVAGSHAFEKVSAGVFSACALTSAGAAFCWGLGRYGALGTGDTTSRLVPWPVAGSTSFSELSVGATFACGLARDGAAWCWGYNANGAIGDGTRIHRFSPTPVAGNLRFVRLSAGWNHVCGIATTGRAWCWGYGTRGQIGNGTTVDAQQLPLEVSGGLSWRDISAGESNTCGIEASGQVYCWGNNFFGQVGDGTRTMRLVPTGVLP